MFTSKQKQFYIQSLEVSTNLTNIMILGLKIIN